MSLDRRLVGIIKENFAAKSSAQLHEILQSNDRERWSEEAFVAAQELLAERVAGQAVEPSEPEEDDPTPIRGHTETSLAIFAGLNMITMPMGLFVIPINRGQYRPDEVAEDIPVAFGSKIAWLALDTTDTEAVAAALGLQEVRVATWEEGIAAAKKSSVFVTPPVGQWTLAVSADLNAFEQTAASVRPLLERLSRKFRDAQYFCTNQDNETHIWARARRGEFVRGFGYSGKRGEVYWNEGGLTPEERDLGFKFGPGESPTEESVMQLAYVWSIDPTALNEDYKEPVMGLLGEFTKIETAG